MKAYNKYKVAAKQGNKEAQRRIAQSYGYQHTLLDQPDMVGFLNRAGVVLYNELPEGYSDKDRLSL